MKKLTCIIFALLFLALSACQRRTPTLADTAASATAQTQTSRELQNHQPLDVKPTGEVVEITERLFIAQSNDIYINPQDYLGKTIKYEGLYKSTKVEGEDCRYVIRYGPGCCGYDGEAGLEIVGADDQTWPEINDWCQVVGVLETFEIDGAEYLRLRLSSLTVLDQRGEEYVFT